MVQKRAPVVEIGRVAFDMVDGKAKLRAEECGGEFGEKLFTCVAHVAETPRAEVPVEARRMTRPVPEFMQKGGVVLPPVCKRRAWWEADDVVCGYVARAVAAVADDGGHGRERRASAASDAELGGVDG